MSDTVVRSKKFISQRKPFGGGGRGGFKNKGNENGRGVSDLRSVLAKKQAANIVDLRTKLKPKALYTSKLASRTQAAPAAQQKQPQQSVGVNNTRTGRKSLKLTPNFKSSVSSAVSGASSKPSPRERGSSRSAPMSHRSRSASHKPPSYEEAKKISVTVPGLSRPVSEHTSLRREERLAAQIARSKEMRQESFTRGREEFLASAITMANMGGAASAGHDRGERERDRGVTRMPVRRYPSRSPSPPPPIAADYTAYDSLYPLEGFGSKVAAPAHSYVTGGNRPRGITTVTSMIISNLSDTVSKNDVAELCSVVGSLDGVYMHAPGIAEVVFKYKDDALEAYKKYNQRNLDGQPMHCKLQPASRSRATGYGSSYMDEYYHSGSGFF